MVVTLQQGVTVVWIMEAQLDSRKRGSGEGLTDLEVGACHEEHAGPGWKLVDAFSGAPDWEPGIPASLMAECPLAQHPLGGPARRAQEAQAQASQALGWLFYQDTALGSVYPFTAYT